VKVSLGVGESKWFRRCPWASALADPSVTRWLTGFWYTKQFGCEPPGRSDPRLLEAVAVIEGEHDRITREETLARSER